MRLVLLMFGVSLAAGTAFFLNSCSTVPATILAPQQIPGAKFVGDKVCAECHTNISRIFPTSAHARIRLDSEERVGLTGCESCHGPGSLHVQAGGGQSGNILNPGHDPALCLQCHRAVEAQFHLPQRHPVLEKKMNCTQCHDPHGSDILKPAGGLAMARLNESCAQCHREQTRPVAFEHPALREGCTTCHTPHGSVNAKMLTQPDMNLCLRCHAQVQGSKVLVNGFFIGTSDHTAFMRLGSCWTSGCHTDVHGSNVDPRLRY